jgi:hypothetical protein
MKKDALDALRRALEDSIEGFTSEDQQKRDLAECIQLCLPHLSIDSLHRIARAVLKEGKAKT